MADQPQGFAFPFAIDARTGGIARAEGAEKLRQNLKHLLLTSVGERAMLREYGGGVRALYQENINDGLLAVARHQITRALVRFEPRILPQEVNVVPREGQLFLVVRYIVPGNAAVQQTVIPLD
ncbi:MAG TPA: GPW/gp25 family protein [Polyangiales bacterium]|nr:GPW/gp25 family protein [Polyangiales bacterium]